jgi:hypothetical protein
MEKEPRHGVEGKQEHGLRPSLGRDESELGSWIYLLQRHRCTEQNVLERSGRIGSVTCIDTQDPADLSRMCPWSGAHLATGLFMYERGDKNTQGILSRLQMRTALE